MLLEAVSSYLSQIFETLIPYYPYPKISTSTDYPIISLKCFDRIVTSVEPDQTAN